MTKTLITLALCTLWFHAGCVIAPIATPSGKSTPSTATQSITIHIGSTLKSQYINIQIYNNTTNAITKNLYCDTGSSVEINDIKPGKYTIIAKKEGFVSQKFIFNYMPGQELVISIKMTPPRNPLDYGTFDCDFPGHHYYRADRPNPALNPDAASASPRPLRSFQIPRPQPPRRFGSAG